jgi:hypothetical protein
MVHIWHLSPQQEGEGRGERKGEARRCEARGGRGEDGREEKGRGGIRRG